ncbi:hypothetical protein [Flavihumibacter fluvii]|uniref:hypothetical protein n=1 Tax=Flavihumibacter fluvii TaxID=2838157 RepID=UPI001BDE70F0|nr:hypothetical protein [Flavihumibacter fluvii]ULQ54130.1 hypothetical protein KJS93_07330 [Flavihumibacter fluvii]
MKLLSIILCLICFAILFSHCKNSVETNIKDLDQNMQDMSMYHDNLGIHLRKGDADYSSWLLEGMDSSLQVIATQFDRHRKLTTSFEKSYEKRLLPSIKIIRKALQENDFPAAIAGYRVLTKKCNGCHIDHDIDKEVKDLSDPIYNEEK